MSVQMNPDCVDGKHQSCSGLGWDLVKDEPADCTCACHDLRCDPKNGVHVMPHRGCILR